MFLWKFMHEYSASANTIISHFTWKNTEKQFYLFELHSLQRTKISMWSSSGFQFVNSIVFCTDQLDGKIPSSAMVYGTFLKGKYEKFYWTIIFITKIGIGDIPLKMLLFGKINEKETHSIPCKSDFLKHFLQILTWLWLLLKQ